MTATDPGTPSAGDHQEDATNKGVSAEDPVEGADDGPGETDGSPENA